MKFFLLLGSLDLEAREWAKREGAPKITVRHRICAGMVALSRCLVSGIEMFWIARCFPCFVDWRWFYQLPLLGGVLVTAWLAGRGVGAIRRWWGMMLVNGLLVVLFLFSLPTI